MPDECSICLDEIAVATTGCVQLACSHTYHLGCISRWYQTNPSCPECRRAPAEKEAPPPSTRHNFLSSVFGNLANNVVVWEQDDYNRMTLNHSEHFTITLPPMTIGQTSNITPEQINQIQQVLLPNGNQDTNTAAATPEETMDRDVRLVSRQAEVSLDIARDALQRCQGDIVTAIMEITLGPGSSANVPNTLELP